MEKFFVFKITNLNGTSASTTIPCTDYMEALRVKDEIMKKASISCVDVTPVEEEKKKITIEDLAWEMYQSGSLIKWETTPTTRENFATHSNYDMYMKAVKSYLAKGHIPVFKKSNPPKTSYPIIKVPASGHHNWIGGARTMCFVYSKHHGNFILEGYLEEVQKYLKENYTKYFCYFSMWYNGKSRGYWRFWKDRDVTISEPSKLRKTWKWTITSREPRHSWGQPIKIRTELHLKRLPKRWIPEFDKL